MLAFLIIASVVLTLVYVNLGKVDPDSTVPDIRTELGEALYAGAPVAYERITEAEILSIVVSNEKGKFDLTRWPDENGVFWLGYDDGSGQNKTISYVPPIVDAEGDFNYESLYALEQNDGYGTMYMLSYLCSAVGTVYFNRRIDLPADADERLEILTEYGLAGEDANPTVVSFLYQKRDSANKPVGESAIHHIQIGAPALNGDGFYFKVDDRDCVYYTQYSTFKYAQLGFESFIKGALVAAGLSQDKTFEPLLTTEFTEWKNTMHEDGFVTDGSAVISKGNVLTPIKESSTYTPEKYPDGYASVESSELKFDLNELLSHPDVERIKDALVGKSVGEHSSLLLTLISELHGTSDMIIDFGGNESVEYSYAITAIESILDYPGDGAVYENSTAGTPVPLASNLLRVTYDYYVGGEKKNTVARHAVVDISSTLVSEEARTALRSASVGALAAAIELDITYTKENTLVSTEALIVSDIIGIYTANGSAESKVGENSYVSLKYYEKIGGVAGHKQPLTIKMSDIKDDAKWSGLYSSLLGQSVGSDLELTAYSGTYYHEIMRSFVTYEITEIECYVTSEEIVSFRFVNESVRDPFYGESVYENVTGKYSLYGVDADVCQNVLKIVGGLSDDTTSASKGLAGETVAVGLTHEMMKKYNLYDYTIYFELPRSIYTETINPEDGGEVMEDYGWQSTLGFTLYISKADPATGKRYVGSDMYDLVASIDASTFEFLDYGFVDFWARSSMIMLELSYVDTFNIDFYMEDVTGSYDFEIKKETVYVHPSYGNPSYTPYDGAVEQDYFTVYVTESGNVMKDTELHKFSESIGSDRVALHALYNKVMGGGKDLLLPNSVEWVGVSNFMLAFKVMQTTPYEGAVTDEERAKASDANKLMKITLGLDAPNASALDYVYEFYRVSDRKVMVKTYKANSSGEQIGQDVSSFYISTFAFKKMVNAYLTVFNAGEVNGEVAYVDEKTN